MTLSAMSLSTSMALGASAAASTARAIQASGAANAQTALIPASFPLPLGTVAQHLHQLCSGKPIGENPTALENLKMLVVARGLVAEGAWGFADETANINLIRKSLRQPFSDALKELASEISSRSAEQAVKALIASGLNIQLLPALVHREALSFDAATNFIETLTTLQNKTALPNLTSLQPPSKRRTAAISVAMVGAGLIVSGVAGYEIAISWLPFFATPEVLLTGFLGGLGTGGTLGGISAFMRQKITGNAMRRHNLTLLETTSAELMNLRMARGSDDPYR
jgi:hypothetical protein